MIPLTKGALSDIARGIEIDKPVFQILGTKRLTSSESERFRLLLSDGETSTSFTMLATQLNHLVTENKLSEYSIVEVNRYAMSNANSAGKPRKIMVVLDITVKVPGNKVGGKIGNPVPDKGIDSSGGANASTASTAKGAPASPTVQKPAPKPMPQSPANTSTRQRPRLNDSINAGIDIQTTPIEALSPFQNRWVIKARVTHKGDVRTWSNSRGEGKVFNITLTDESGEIRCTGFTDAVTKFYDMIEVGKVYYISRCTLKVANKAFNNTNSEYEMTLNGDSEIIECHGDANDIPDITYNFVPLGELADRPVNDICDILAIVKSAESIQKLVAKKDNRELKKRDLTLVDMSDVSITLTLWGTQAENFDGSTNPVVAAKNVRLSEFNNGKTLSLISTSLLQIEPDIPDAHRLRGWYSTIGKSQEVKSLSKGMGGGMNADWMTIHDAYEKSVRSPETGAIFLCKAVITLIRHDRALYKSCPTENCKKKVVDQDNGMFRCEKCNQEYPNFMYRILASMSLADWSGNQWVTAFGEDGEQILGTSAQILGEMSENEPDEYAQKFADIAFSSYIFKLKLKSETYNDEKRQKGVILSSQPIDYNTYIKHLVGEMKKMNNMHDAA